MSGDMLRNLEIYSFIYYREGSPKSFTSIGWTLCLISWTTEFLIAKLFSSQCEICCKAGVSLCYANYFRAEAKITEEHIFIILQIECNVFKYHEQFNEEGKWKSDEIERGESCSGRSDILVHFFFLCSCNS